MKRIRDKMSDRIGEALPRDRVAIFFLAFTALVIAASVWGPEALTGYKDKEILNETHWKEIEEAGEGYRYSLNGNEKLYILSQCLNSQALPESEQNAWTRNETSETGYQGLGGTYAFVVNHKGPSGEEITDEEIYGTCNSSLEMLAGLGILPEGVKKIEKGYYDRRAGTEK